jgi:hypothetical protein
MYCAQASAVSHHVTSRIVHDGDRLSTLASRGDRKRIDLTETSAKRGFKTLDSVLSDHELADDDMCPGNTARSTPFKVGEHTRPRDAMFGVNIQVVHD